MDERKSIEVVDGEISMAFLYTKTAPALIEEVIARDCYDIRNLKLDEGCIMDFGANEGMFAIWAAKKWPDKTVYAFEPVSETFKTLRENIELNGLTNIVANRCGIGPEAGEVELIISKDYSGGSSSWITFNGRDHNKEIVPVITVDHALGHIVSNMVDKPGIALMKVDIEGAEYEALYALKEWNRIGKLVIEVHINRRLEYEGRRPDGLITWLSNRTRVHKVVPCKMLD